MEGIPDNVNRRGEIPNLYAGSFRETHAARAAEDVDHYGIEHTGDFDIAVCNAYGKVNEVLSLCLLACS